MILCQTSIRQFCKKMFLNYFLSTADMMKCYKGQQHFATENLFYNFPHHLTRSPMSTKSIIGIGCEAIKNGWKVKTWKSQMRNWQPFTALLLMWVTEWRRDGGRESERERVRRRGKKGRVKVVINLMEKSNTKQIHSSKLDASVVLFLACAKP